MEAMKTVDAVIIRCNPGHIDAQTGGSQAKFDEAMREVASSGVTVWSSSDLKEFMGAKDALCKIRDLDIGLADTAAYYDEEAFISGFKKTMAF